ncbi:MAG: AlpA family phage regulatory protein [Burkholderiales bacterium]|nr:AlpA family phage regulatory protein [Burkholderiales bacterium]
MPDIQEPNGQSVQVPPPIAPAFYRIADVVRLTALSRATIYRRIADGRFPRPVHLGGRACGWVPDELQAWIDAPGEYRTALAASSAIQEHVRPRRNNMRRLNLSRFSRRKFRTQVGHEGSTKRAKEKAPTASVP